MERIFLIGPPGAGKTACGQALARRLNCAFYDTDQLIENSAKKKISAIFATEGEAEFRSLETQLLSELPKLHEDSGETVVYGTGGGLPIYNNNLSRLQGLGKVIALTADVAVLVDRVKSNHDRPLLTQTGSGDADKHLNDRLSELLAQRSHVYDRAGYKIDTSGLDPDQVANEILRILYAQ